MPIKAKECGCMKRCRRAIAVGLAMMFAGCRLYEPQRYERLSDKAGTPMIRVLMIGDSLTYYNDLPGLLQQFTIGEATPIYVEQSTTPYASLKFHWDMGKSIERIHKGHWDYVVLQDFSRKPVTDPDDCIKYYALFNDEIKRSGAKTIIFQNWTRRDMEKDYGTMKITYDKIQALTRGHIAPIGAAWRQCATSRPDIRLLIDDRHPTNAGSYLAACVLYDVLYNKQAGALPSGVAGPKWAETELMALRSFADGAGGLMTNDK